MYYVLAAIFFIIVYFALTKILSSLLKGCLVTLGIFIFVVSAFIFLRSTKEEVILFNRYKIENFKVTKIENVNNTKGIFDSQNIMFEKGSNK